MLCIKAFSPSGPSESSGLQSLPSGSAEPCGASCSGAVGGSSAPAEASSEGGSLASSPLERSQRDSTEDTSGGCRRAEPAAEEGQEGEEAKSQPARGNQDSDDSDDDPILIPSTRFRGQGQRYERPAGASAPSRTDHCLLEANMYYWVFILF